MLKKLSLCCFIVVTVNSFAQSPGGVGTTDLTSWFKADQLMFSDLGTTPCVNGGDEVRQWNNIMPNSALPAVIRDNSNRILNLENPYHNFNDAIIFTSDYMTGSGISQGSIFSPADGMAAFTASTTERFPLVYWSNYTGAPCGSGRCAVGFLNNKSKLGNESLTYSIPEDDSRANIISLWGDFVNGRHNNSMNGNYNSAVQIPAFSNLGDYNYTIGAFPWYLMVGQVNEVITFDRELSMNEVTRIESYLALKNGVTLGVNGTSIDYLSANSFDVWTQSANAGYAYDIAGLARDDASGLSQLKSHSVNNSALIFDDIVTIVNGTTFSTPVALTTDESFFIWGHNGGAKNNTGGIVNYSTDNLENIETLFARHWKGQETGTIGSVTLEFDMSNVVGVGGVIGANDLANLRLLVDEDGDFSTGATSYLPTSFDNATGIAYFQHDFIPESGNPLDQGRGFFFTLASTDFLSTPLPVVLMSFEVMNEACTNLITWETSSEQNCDYFKIERSYDAEDWEFVGKVKGAGNSNETLYYQFTDAEISEKHLVYYRLTQVDFDGTNRLERIRAVESNCFNFSGSVIYPNPVIDELTIFSQDPGDVKLYDQRGAIVKSVKLSKGNTILNLSALSAGVYSIVIIQEDGNIQVEKIVKN